MPQFLQKLVFSLVAVLCFSAWVQPLCAANAEDVAQLTNTLDELDAWVGDGTNGDKWRKYLQSDKLRLEIEKGAEADPTVVARALQQYRSSAKGLQKRRFVAVRRELQAWYDDLRNQHATDLPKLVWAARGDHHPLTDEKFASVRDNLIQSANRLEERLGIGSTFTENWKTYLHWPQLTRHFDKDQKINNQSLQELDTVLKRLRSNKPGLENPVFAQLASAIERYRELAVWHTLGKRLDTRKRYSAISKQLQKFLTRNLESPTVESTRQIGKIVGMMDHLGDSPLLVEQVREKFDRPNLTARISTALLNQVGKRPVSETQPVIDCILGASVRGTANSCGTLSLTTLPAADHIAIELQLSGNIQSRTASYKKPVRVGSLGSTNFVATKRLAINDDRFLIMPASASARTKTRVVSIRKTGGRFGKRLVERIARKKVAKSKPQAEYIGARHAEKKVATKFDNQVVEAVYQARDKYDNKFRSSLQRIGMFPDHLLMASSSQDIRIETTLASAQQISTHLLPPATLADNDMNLQVHETALNNFFPHFLGGAKLGQEKQSEPPKLEGDIPAWLKNLTGAPQVKQQFTQTAKTPTLAGPANADEQSDIESPEFKPWAFQFNREHPVSVSFDNQRIELRIRIAELKTIEDGEESIRKNWDFLVAYKVIQAGNGILLRRDGDIQALPTGFDPQWFGDKRWNDKLSAKQAGVRNNLEKNINKRAADGQGFPLEIPIPAIQLPLAGGIKQTLSLQQLDCDNGWLTVGYQL